MPGRLKVKILAGKHLPVMDRASESTDAFVEVGVSEICIASSVCANNLKIIFDTCCFYLANSKIFALLF